MWVDCSDGVPIGAEVRLSDTGQLQLIDDEGKVIYVALLVGVGFSFVLLFLSISVFLCGLISRSTKLKRKVP